MEPSNAAAGPELERKELFVAWNVTESHSWTFDVPVDFDPSDGAAIDNLIAETNSEDTYDHLVDRPIIEVDIG